MICLDNNRVNEIMSQVYSHSFNQNVISAQYTISRNCPTNEAQGELKGEISGKPEELSGSSPLRSDGSREGQVGRPDDVSSGQKTLEVK
jgi:hypothetical protein